MLTCQKEGEVLSIVGELQVTFLDTLQGCLADCLYDPLPLTLDLSGVTEVDTAGIQLLETFFRSRGRQVPTTITALSPALARGCRLVGLGSDWPLQTH